MSKHTHSRLERRLTNQQHEQRHEREPSTCGRYVREQIKDREGRQALRDLIQD